MWSFACPKCGQKIQLTSASQLANLQCKHCGAQFQLLGPSAAARPEEAGRKPLQQIVEELGRYPLEAFQFVQEGLGFAAEQVHGPKRPEHRAVEQWMDRNGLDLVKLRELYEAGKLPKDIQAKIRKLGGPERLNRHVSGQQLCWGLRDLALQRWGLMASAVLRRWKITSTRDFGRIVFALVENDYLQKQPSDSPEDFEGVYDFEEAFAEGFRIPCEPTG